MPRRRTTLLVLLVAACGAPADRSAASRGATSAASDSTAIAVSGEWPSDLGAALVIPADTENLAVVLYPAATTVVLDPKAVFALRSAGGETVRARAGVTGPDSAHCGDAPVVHLLQSTPSVWSLGVSGAVAQPLHADSLEALTAADSVQYLAATARLASAVVAPASSRLSGLNFTLAALRRIRLADTTVIVAELVRRLNQEANPIEERTLVVAEQRGKSAFVTVHSSRSEGTDETAAHHELAGAFRSTGTAYLLLTTDTPVGSTIEILERSGGSWRVRWTRSIAC